MASDALVQAEEIIDAERERIHRVMQGFEDYWRQWVIPPSDPIDGED